MSLKICYIISTTNNCGPVNVLLSIIKGIRYQFKNVEISILVLKKDNNTKSKKQDFLNQGVEIVKVDSIFQLVNYINKNKFDVIHSHGILPDTINYLVKNLNKALNITTLHNYPFEDYVLTYGKVKGYLMARWQTFLAKKLDAIACSRSIQQKMLKHDVEVHYIQNGVHFQENECFITNQYKNFIYIGEINKRKNVKFLLEYFMMHPEYIFTIIGDGSQFDILKEKTKSFHNIKWLGRQENVISYLNEADVFISASLSEGMPMAILESLSCGKPNILSDILSHKEIYDDMTNGIWLFKNNSIESLHQAISDYTGSYIDSKKIYDEAEKKFSEQRMANKYYEYYTNRI